MFRLPKIDLLIITTDNINTCLPLYTIKKHRFTILNRNNSNSQWYERYNTKADVGQAIGVTRQHKALLDYVAMEMHSNSFASLGLFEQEAVRKDAEERDISYAFLRQSGSQHNKLKEDLQNDFTTGDNRYPKTREQTIHLLDKYRKISVLKTTQSEGTSFSKKTDKEKVTNQAKEITNRVKRRALISRIGRIKNVSYAIRKGIQHHIARKEMITTTTCHALAKQRVSRS
jgi:hypothetical protein